MVCAVVLNGLYQKMGISRSVLVRFLFLTCSVTQGSVLGPSLFPLYMFSCISSRTDYLSLQMITDDNLLLYFTVKHVVIVSMKCALLLSFT